MEQASLLLEERETICFLGQAEEGEIQGCSESSSSRPPVDESDLRALDPAKADRSAVPISVLSPGAEAPHTPSAFPREVMCAPIVM
jgi:hypothetical protein